MLQAPSSEQVAANCPTAVKITIVDAKMQILRHFIGKFVVVYFDNILIYNSSQIKHIIHLRQICTVMRKEQCYVNPKKCTFLTTQVYFLGFVVSVDGVCADPENVRVINEWPEPKSIRE